MKTDPDLEFEAAYCGFSQRGRAYVPYSGRLTVAKRQQAELVLKKHGYEPGWKSRNIRVWFSGGMASYREEGAGGLVPMLEIFHIQGNSRCTQENI